MAAKTDVLFLDDLVGVKGKRYDKIYIELGNILECIYGEKCSTLKLIEYFKSLDGLYRQEATK